MDRLYAPLAAISRGIDHLILQNVIILVMFGMFAFAIDFCRRGIVSVNNRLKAMLIDTSSWPRVADVAFHVLPNGRVEWVSPDGLGSGRSVERLESFITRRLKARGQSLNVAAFRSFVANRPPLFRDESLSTLSPEEPVASSVTTSRQRPIVRNQF